MAIWLSALTLAAAVGLGLFVGPSGVLALTGVGVVALFLVVAWRLPGGRAPATPSRVRAAHVSLDELQEGSAKPPFSDLWGYVLIALVIRLVLVVVVNESSLWLAFGRDAITWENFGQEFVRFLEAPNVLAAPGIERVVRGSFYTAANGVALLLFDSSRYPMSVVNAFVGVFVAWLLAQLALSLFGRAVARRTLLLALFYPSLCLWSVMNIREVWAYTAILLVLIAGHRAKTKFAPMSILLLLASLLWLYYIRSYLLPLFVLGTLGSFAAVRLRQLPAALFGLTILGGVLFAYGGDFGLSNELFSEERLSEIQHLRESLAYGGSAYGADVDTSTIAGSLAYLPQGILRFLFAPFPWNVRSWQQLLAAPESLVFFVLTIQAVLQGLRELRTRSHAVILPLLTTFLIICAYGLVSGNEGTAFRHRAQPTLVLLMFAAAYQERVRSERRSRQAPPREELDIAPANPRSGQVLA